MSKKTDVSKENLPVEEKKVQALKDKFIELKDLKNSLSKQTETEEKGRIEKECEQKTEELKKEIEAHLKNAQGQEKQEIEKLKKEVEDFSNELENLQNEVKQRTSTSTEKKGETIID